MKNKVINKKIFNKKNFVKFARLSLFIIFFWFGILKVFGLSPASEVVENLFENTIPFMSFSLFLILFGIFECIIGILFLFKGTEKIVIPLFFAHMITTFGPLVFNPQETWQRAFVPTLEGQYIIKNLALVATVFFVYTSLENKK